MGSVTVHISGRSAAVVRAYMDEYKEANLTFTEALDHLLKATYFFRVKMGTKWEEIVPYADEEKGETNQLDKKAVK